MSNLNDVAEAMKARRRELIAQPLDRIWPDLAKAALAASPGPAVWQPIATAPKDGTFVLVFCAGGSAWCPTIARWNDGKNKNPNGEVLESGWGDEIGTYHLPGLNMPTHWQPLPDLPTPEQHVLTQERK